MNWESLGNFEDILYQCCFYIVVKKMQNEIVELIIYQKKCLYQ